MAAQPAEFHILKCASRNSSYRSAFDVVSSVVSFGCFSFLVQPFVLYVCLMRLDRCAEWAPAWMALGG